MKQIMAAVTRMRYSAIRRHCSACAAARSAALAVSGSTGQVPKISAMVWSASGSARSCGSEDKTVTIFESNGGIRIGIPKVGTVTLKQFDTSLIEAQVNRGESG